jgi:hypothetical protein
MYSSLPWAGSPYTGPAPTTAHAATGKRVANGAADSSGAPKRPKPNPGHRYSTCYTHFSKLPLDKKKEM